MDRTRLGAMSRLDKRGGLEFDRQGFFSGSVCSFDEYNQHQRRHQGKGMNDQQAVLLQGLLQDTELQFKQFTQSQRQGYSPSQEDVNAQPRPVESIPEPDPRTRQRRAKSRSRSQTVPSEVDFAERSIQDGLSKSYNINSQGNARPQRKRTPSQYATSPSNDLAYAFQRNANLNILDGAPGSVGPREMLVQKQTMYKHPDDKENLVLAESLGNSRQIRNTESRKGSTAKLGSKSTIDWGIREEVERRLEEAERPLHVGGSGQDIIYINNKPFKVLARDQGAKLEQRHITLDKATKVSPGRPPTSENVSDNNLHSPSSSTSSSSSSLGKHHLRSASLGNFQQQGSEVYVSRQGNRRRHKNTHYQPPPPMLEDPLCEERRRGRQEEEVGAQEVRDTGMTGRPSPCNVLPSQPNTSPVSDIDFLEDVPRPVVTSKQQQTRQQQQQQYSNNRVTGSSDSGDKVAEHSQKQTYQNWFSPDGRTAEAHTTDSWDDELNRARKQKQYGVANNATYWGVTQSKGHKANNWGGSEQNLQRSSSETSERGERMKSGNDYSLQGLATHSYQHSKAIIDTALQQSVAATVTGTAAAAAGGAGSKVEQRRSGVLRQYHEPPPPPAAATVTTTTTDSLNLGTKPAYYHEDSSIPKSELDSAQRYNTNSPYREDKHNAAVTDRSSNMIAVQRSSPNSHAINDGLGKKPERPKSSKLRSRRAPAVEDTFTTAVSNADAEDLRLELGELGSTMEHGAKGRKAKRYVPEPEPHPQILKKRERVGPVPRPSSAWRRGFKGQDDDDDDESSDDSDVDGEIEILDLDIIEAFSDGGEEGARTVVLVHDETASSASSDRVMTPRLTEREMCDLRLEKMHSIKKSRRRFLSDSSIAAENEDSNVLPGDAAENRPPTRDGAASGASNDHGAGITPELVYQHYGNRVVDNYRRRAASDVSILADAGKTGATKLSPKDKPAKLKPLIPSQGGSASNSSDCDSARDNRLLPPLAKKSSKKKHKKAETTSSVLLSKPPVPGKGRTKLNPLPQGDAATLSVNLSDVDQDDDELENESRRLEREIAKLRSLALNQTPRSPAATRDEMDSDKFFSSTEREKSVGYSQEMMRNLAKSRADLNGEHQSSHHSKPEQSLIVPAKRPLGVSRSVPMDGQRPFNRKKSLSDIMHDLRKGTNN